MVSIKLAQAKKLIFYGFNSSLFTLLHSKKRGLVLGTKLNHIAELVVTPLSAAIDAIFDAI